MAGPGSDDDEESGLRDGRGTADTPKCCVRRADMC